MTAIASSKGMPRWRTVIGIAALAAIHLGAIYLLINTEQDHAGRVAFVLFWCLLNSFWLALFRRPGPAAVVSFAMLLVLIMLSRFKFDALFLTATFTDVMIIDPDTAAYLWAIFPNMGLQLATIGTVALTLVVLLWNVGPFRPRRLMAVFGLVLFAALLTALSFAVPLDREDEHRNRDYVSKFARSAAITLVDFLTRGFLKSDCGGCGTAEHRRCRAMRQGCEAAAYSDDSGRVRF